MHAMILAAGRGERMRPITDMHPKPLLLAGGKSLVAWQVERLVKAGFTDITINVAWLSEQLRDALGDGSAYGAQISYSFEAIALETLGGIVQALPLLGRDPFVVVSGDIYTEFDYARLIPHAERLARTFPDNVAHLVLTNNPPYHPSGDMGLSGSIITQAEPRYTYANIGVFHPLLFEGVEVNKVLKLFPWMYRYADMAKITGELFFGEWDNIGTPEQLAGLERRLQAT
jgi:N-acetyl-alpha-D-muramate 1-phosphate uridylyltransferase